MAMKSWRSRLLATYLGISHPYRWWASRRWCARGLAPISILFHHRIADDRKNDWTISCAAFERQLDWLQQHREIISLAEAQARISAGRNDRLAVCITFDDGYADNCLFAVPLLLKRSIPFTYFVTTKHIARQEPFPHDARRGLPLAPNTVDQIRAMADAGVEIGVHSRSHVDFGQINELQVVEDEIVGAKQEIEGWIGRATRFFAFPFGMPQNLSCPAIDVIRQSGLSGFCSAFGGYNWPRCDSFHLRRFHADEDFQQFLNWVTICPRKQVLTERAAAHIPCSASSGSVSSGSASSGSASLPASAGQAPQCLSRVES